jgi:hypothetical protein
MSRIAGSFLVLGLGLWVVAPEDPGQERRATPPAERIVRRRDQVR